MEDLSKKLVYHGSPKEFESEKATPKRNIRKKWNPETKSHEVIFDQESFHATPHKWIALAYTYKSTPVEINGRTAHYNMGVSLYENTHEVTIFGVDSLEESLGVLYGKGGYIYHFENDKFLYKEGLGNLEVIAEEETLPIHIEKINDPVTEMKKLGVKFDFIDLSLQENENYRS